MANEVVQIKDVGTLLQQQMPAFQSALGDPELAKTFVRVALTMVRMTPGLTQCDQASFLGGLMLGAQLKLQFQLGLAYLIPYWSSKHGHHIAQFQVGYQGWIDLFYRHPMASELYAEVVYKNDKFKISKGTDRAIIHEPHYDGDRGEAVGYYAVAKLKTGAMNFVYMSRNEMELYRNRYARADKYGKYGVWDSNFEEMALKTCIKRTLKYMPKSVELRAAMETDEAVKRPINTKDMIEIDSVPALFEESNQTEEIVESREPDPNKRTRKPKEPAVEEVITEVTSTTSSFITTRDKLLKRIEDSPVSEEDKAEWKLMVLNESTVPALLELSSSFGRLEAQRANDA